MIVVWASIVTLERSPPLTFHLLTSKIVWVIGIGSDKTGRRMGDGKSTASLDALVDFSRIHLQLELTSFTRPR